MRFNRSRLDRDWIESVSHPDFIWIDAVGVSRREMIQYGTRSLAVDPIVDLVKIYNSVGVSGNVPADQLYRILVGATK